MTTAYLNRQRQINRDMSAALNRLADTGAVPACTVFPHATAGMSYPERRSAAIALAAAHDGWGRPPTPEGIPPIYRIIRTRFVSHVDFFGPCYRWRSHRVLNTAALEIEAKETERRQNREKFA